MIGAKVDHRALPGEDVARGARRDDRAGHPVGAIDGDRRVHRIDRRHDVDRGAERPGRRAIVGRAVADRSTSLSPSREKPPMIPGVTHLPRASTISAPRGIGMPTPAPTILPFWMTTVPPTIGSDPSPSATVPPVIAMVCAASGAEPHRTPRRSGGSSLHISFARLAEFEIAYRAKPRVGAVVHQRTVDPHLVGARVGAERIAVPQHDDRPSCRASGCRSCRRSQAPWRGCS